jgi:TRAP-type transport system periplasmic protein
MGSHSPAGSPNSKFFNAWAQKVNERSKGAIQIEVRDGAAMSNFGNVYDRVQSDVIQIGWALHSLIGGKFPLSEVAGLPFVSAGGVEATIALWNLHQTGLLDEEYADVVPLVFGVFGPAQLHFAKEQPKIENLAGLKIGAQGRVPSQIVSGLSGTPVSVPPQDMYEAVQRGTVDGMIASWAAFAPYRYQEVTSYHVEAPMGQQTSMFFMSRARFNALSPEAQKVLKEVAAESTSREFSEFFYGEWSRYRQQVVGDSKHKVEQPTAEQMKLWESKASPVIDEWVKGRKNGERALATYRELYAKAKK